ncbi:tetratricopeptide repeat protein [Streptomyces malaysiensis]|uniref:tetratricopeptide repeat protein n=1 Tax=Streptomyces malaysiensis TaxID=92644 RepID=UPI002B2C6ACE|nr:tetratricopeptide repeat protein [Streptomyces malaysiensis]
MNHPDRADHIDFGSGHFSGRVVGKMVVHHHQPSPGPTPGTLFSQPAPHPGFVGRLTELDSLLDVLRPAGRGEPGHGDVTAAAVAGLGGVGKTALALQAAYEAQRRGWFPGGVLFVDLHGYDGTALTPERALESLLRALGVAPEHIPPTVDERAGLYRSLLSGIAAETGPVLVLADNAAQSSQVRPLIPGHPGHRLLVTSRDTLAQLGVYQLHLQVLPPPAAMEVLTAAVRNAQPRDTRIAAERSQAERLCRLCGYLPLALQIAAALLIADPGKPIEELAGELAGVATRVDYLDDGERGVRAAFDLSYGRLTDEQSWLFLLLALAPGEGISAETLSVSYGAPLPPRGVDVLVRAHLVEPRDTGGRWRMHDLLRAYAAAKVAADGARFASAYERSRARILDHYNELVVDAGGLTRVPPVRGPHPRFAGRADALAWLDGERTGLVEAACWAAEPRHARAATKLALDLGEYLGRRRLYGDAIVVYRHAINGARALGDRRSEGKSWNNLSIALRRVRRLEEAADACHRALDAYEREDSAESRGRAWNNLGNALVELRRVEDAAAAYEKAIRVSRLCGNGRTVAMAENSLGSALHKLGRLDEAMECLVRARDTGRELADFRVEATADNNIGRVLRGLGRFEEALANHGRARDLFRDNGDREGEATSHNERALTLASLGRLTDAVKEHHIALRIFREVGERHREAVVTNDLGLSLRAMGRLPEAAESHLHALRIFEGLGDAYHRERTAGLLAEARAAARPAPSRAGRRR